MNKKINGKTYNTETAKAIFVYEGGEGECAIKETLYKKRTGEFFLFCEGGNTSPYAACSIEDNGFIAYHRFIVLKDVMVREWVATRIGDAAYLEMFGQTREEHWNGILEEAKAEIEQIKNSDKPFDRHFWNLCETRDEIESGFSINMEADAAWLGPFVPVNDPFFGWARSFRH